MHFRLNKHEDELTLEAFLKAVGADDDYQQIRFMIKDGKVWVNGEKEYARRRMLREGDNVAFLDRYYIIFPHRDGYDRPEKRREFRKREDTYDDNRKTEKVLHHKKPLQWAEKGISKRTKKKNTE